MLRNIILDYKRRIKSATLGEDILDLASKNMVMPAGFEYEIIEVSKRSIARPDLLSVDLYGVPDYGALLCKINGIANPQELNEGMRIVAPIQTYIDRFLYIDDDPEEDKSTTDTPKAKKKNEKRAPNEAIIGDTRFKIDRENRIVVY